MEKLKYRYIDLQSLRDETLNDIEILIMVSELFIEGIEDYINILNNEIKNKNWHLLFQATHKIKPNITMFGITKLEPAILELENNFKKEQNLDNVQSRIDSCIDILNTVKIELQTELKSLHNE